MSELRREYTAGRKLPRAETVRSLWSYVIPEDVPIEATFDVDFWRRATEQLKPGDRIEVTSADRYTQYEITILASNSQSEPPRLDMVFRTIFPVDLKVPAPIVAPSRWRVKQRATDGLYYVWDHAAGEIVADGLRREDALQRVGLLEKLAKEQDEAAKIVPPPKPRGRPVEGPAFAGPGKAGKGGDPTPAGWYSPEAEAAPVGAGMEK